MRNYFLALCLLVCVNIFAQKNDSLMAVNRKYKNEIGIDFQGLFKGTPGTALIWKKKKVGRLVSLTFCSNYRVQLALSGNIQLTQKTTQKDTTFGHYIVKQPSQYSVQPLFGIERVNFFGKFNLYYGADFGPSYTYSSNQYNVYIYSNTNNNYTYYGGSYGANTSNVFGFSIIPFVGIKYRISERFSASMESAFSLGYSFTNTKYYVYNFNAANQSFVQKDATETNTHGLVFAMRYLRFLTLNYHF